MRSHSHGRIKLADHVGEPLQKFTQAGLTLQQSVLLLAVDYAKGEGRLAAGESLSSFLRQRLSLPSRGRRTCSRHVSVRRRGERGGRRPTLQLRLLLLKGTSRRQRRRGLSVGESLSGSLRQRLSLPSRGRRTCSRHASVRRRGERGWWRLTLQPRLLMPRGASHRQRRRGLAVGESLGSSLRQRPSLPSRERRTCSRPASVRR